jgi:hypothetical protein
MEPNPWASSSDLGQGLRWPNFSSWTRLFQVHFHPTIKPIATIHPPTVKPMSLLTEGLFGGHHQPCSLVALPALARALMPWTRNNLQQGTKLLTRLSLYIRNHFQHGWLCEFVNLLVNAHFNPYVNDYL